VGLNRDPATLDTQAIAKFTAPGGMGSVTDFLLNVIPGNVVDAFAKGDILQVLLFSVLFGFALHTIGGRYGALYQWIERFSAVMFGIVKIIMRLAPLGAFGAMAFTIGKYGIGSLKQLGALMACFYATCLIFIFVVLGLVARVHGFSVVRFVRYIKEELFIVLGTSSSESALPRMLVKLEALGCNKAIVGLVVPTGYSFNLDGTCIYLTMAALFLAQATNIPLSFGDELSILVILLVSSKGAAAVTGGGFITLAATLGATGKIPVASIALLLGIDRFMSEARALTNLLGNAVATIVVARWENQLDLATARTVLAGRAAAPEVEPGVTL
jgi:aerobic C4-dicarboxylate transport protein